jgi:hypothetical protein
MSKSFEFILKGTFLDGGNFIHFFQHQTGTESTTC